MILIPCPIRPDLDCVACAVGYAEYLRAQNRNAKAWLCGVPDGEAQFYIDAFKDLDFATDDDAKQAEAFILVDISDKNFMPESIPAEKVIQVIDHRFFTTPQTDFPNARIQLDAVGAAATQIIEYFMQDDLLPSEETACMLYGAVYSNTLCFKGELYTERDEKAVTWLKNKNPQADQFIGAQLQARKESVLATFPQVLSDEMKIGTNVSGKFGISQLEMVDALNFWDENKKAIDTHFKQYDFPTFLNVIDLSTNKAILYFNSIAFDKNLGDHITITQRDDTSFHYEPALMRKQIIPFIYTM